MKILGYRTVWIVTMFDLPVTDKKSKKEYQRFRDGLLKDGFAKMQFSVYIRHCASRENADVHIKRVERSLPPRGEVRILTITDKQFERIRVFFGKKRSTSEKPLAQLELF